MLHRAGDCLCCKGDSCAYICFRGMPTNSSRVDAERHRVPGKCHLFVWVLPSWIMFHGFWCLTGTKAKGQALPFSFSSKTLPFLPISLLFAQVNAPATQNLVVLHLGAQSLALPCRPLMAGTREVRSLLLLRHLQSSWAQDRFDRAGCPLGPRAFAEALLFVSRRSRSAWRLPLPLTHWLCFHSQSLLSAPPASKLLSSRPATCCRRPSFIFSSVPVEMPFQNLRSASSKSLFEVPLRSGACRCCISCGSGRLAKPRADPCRASSDHCSAA